MTGTPDRRGEPSPLPFHLGAALVAYANALMAAPRADAADFPWSPHLAAEAAALGPGLDRVEIAREIGARLSATVRGVEAWQRHPFRRREAEPPAIWQAGAARLLDYGQAPEATDPDGPAVLVVPSLINRPYILDLDARCSLLRWLAAQGLRPALLDWGRPGRDEAGFSLDDYAAQRLEPALRHLGAASGRPVALLGYCMGGTLAACLAARRPEGIASLVTIGAPWDFSSTRGIVGGLRAMVRAEGAAGIERQIATLGEAFGFVPASTFQNLFALVNPMQATLKFQRFVRLDPESAAARRFVAIEDWLADGVPMPAPAARDLLVDWHVRNLTAAGRWRLLGGAVDLGQVRAPTLAFCGAHNSIAPSALSLALPRAIPGAETAEPRTGHIGMVVGGVAAAAVWTPLAAFLRAHAGGAAAPAPAGPRRVAAAPG